MAQYNAVARVRSVLLLVLLHLKIILLNYQNNYIRGSNGETDPHRWYIFPPEVVTMISRE
ncbi:hypothetical protein ALC53_06142 [Atta colombica]|uniref:Uncharacterized protein n=1 Tax=Atta colombica TaxID=520822 RepID=A0A195BFP9_9HYME|nr:hypothetical protein ALC53_06142 [Atta colombica]